MTCSICWSWCADDGDWCDPYLGSLEMTPGDRAKMERHDALAHKMRVVGGSWLCAKGHRVEAAPVLVMEAAGASRLEGFR